MDLVAIACCKASVISSRLESCMGVIPASSGASGSAPSSNRNLGIRSTTSATEYRRTRRVLDRQVEARASYASPPGNLHQPRGSERAHSEEASFSPARRLSGSDRTRSTRRFYPPKEHLRSTSSPRIAADCASKTRGNSPVRSNPTIAFYPAELGNGQPSSGSSA